MTTIAVLNEALAGRYLIEQEIGQGGMATVYLARDLKHDRDVAIKVLREDLSASIGAGRFLREIKIAAQLQHPNILPLLDSGEAGGFLYFVMPFVKGPSLRQRLASEGELPVHEAVRLLLEVVDALTEAHSHGIVHRDIKPDNVMLAGRHALVTDFGVAKAVSEATGKNTITTLGVALGTPTYMSPEQAAADPHVDQRADIYAVGVMAYEMLTGRPPFTGATPQQVLAAHVTEPADPVAKRRPTIPAALDQIVMKCLEKRAADRYQNATELHQALEPIATPSAGVTPTRTRPLDASAKPGGLRRALGIVAGVAIVLLGGGIAWWRVGSARYGVPARAIAVLPFDNVGHDTAFDYLADGMANEVRTSLTSIPGLSVKARTSSAAARGKAVREAGALLGVPVLLQGAFRRGGARVAVTVDLVKATDETTLWSHDFTVPADGNFAAIQDSITAAVVRTLNLDAHTTQTAAALRGTRDLEAYDAYLKGQFLFAQRHDFAGLQRSIEAYRRAIARDAGFARAYAGLGMALSVVPAYTGGPTDSVIAEAERQARRALAIEPALADAHLALASALQANMRARDAEPEFRIAVAGDPRNATAHQWHASNLNLMARTDDAVREIHTAIDLDPLSASAWIDQGYIQLCAGQFAEATASLRRAIELGFTGAWGNLATALAFDGHVDSAIVVIDQAFRSDSLDPSTRAFHVWRQVLAGHKSDADREFAVLQRDTAHFYMVTMANLALGNTRAALDGLQRAADTRNYFFVSLLAPGCDPQYALLRDEARFKAMIKQIGHVMCSGPLPALPRPPR